MEAPEIATKPAMKRLAVFLDGTWNAVGDNTNVWRMKALCADEDRNGIKQLTYYDVGVNGFKGGVFGKGLSENINEAYEWLVNNYDTGDEVFIFGFSRGAYTAGSLAGFICKHGLLKRGSPLGVKQLYDRYRRPDDRTIWTLQERLADGTLENPTLEEQWMLKYCQAFDIKVVAVWDTVGTLGIPWFSIEGYSRKTLGFLHTGLRVHLLNAYHALAIDEHRADFAPTLWTVRKPKDPEEKIAQPRSLAVTEQRWFVGAHANVGGGCTSDLLAQVPLRWIMKKASLHGLAFRNDVELDGDVLNAPISDSWSEFMKGIYCKFSKRFYRLIGGEPEVKEDGTHTTVNESIDSTVFDRYRAQENFRPPSLIEWAKRKKVDPAGIKQSVRADNPAVPAPD